VYYLPSLLLYIIGPLREARKFLLLFFLFFLPWGASCLGPNGSRDKKLDSAISTSQGGSEALACFVPRFLVATRRVHLVRPRLHLAAPGGAGGGGVNLFGLRGRCGVARGQNPPPPPRGWPRMAGASPRCCGALLWCSEEGGASLFIFSLCPLTRGYCEMGAL
jgi:hypothetical protein